MKTIYKYPLAVEDTVTISLPLGAQVLTVKQDTTRQLGRGNLVLWAIVEHDQLSTTRYDFEVRGTGHPLGQVGDYISTVQDGPFVWHVFHGVN